MEIREISRVTQLYLKKKKFRGVFARLGRALDLFFTNNLKEKKKSDQIPEVFQRFSALFKFPRAEFRVKNSVISPKAYRAAKFRRN